MSNVYLAEHVMLKRKYAVKMLADHLLKTPGFKDRFFKEGLAQAQLQHDNIVQVIDYIEEDGKTFLLMDYIEGECLDQLINRKGKLSESECIQIMSDILEALNFAHENGVIHRDIKPSNIIISNSGKAKLMDFGIAIMMGDKRMTATGTNIGTSWYMSPEHVTRPKEIDHRSDVYSIGIVLYEMLTGDVPFDGETDYEIKDSHVRKDVIPPIDINNSISLEMNNIVLKALAKNPDERFDGCMDFLDYIEELGDEEERLEKSSINKEADRTEINKDSKKTEIEKNPVYKATEIETAKKDNKNNEIDEDETYQSTNEIEVQSELKPASKFILIGLVIVIVMLLIYGLRNQNITNSSKINHKNTKTPITKTNAKKYDKSFTNSLGMKFVLIPAGSFMMGSPENEKDRDDDEKQHHVTLTKDYYMQTTEITQGQWKAVMGSNPSAFWTCGDNCPVEKVSRDDVQQFIKKLNQKENTTIYRLPTEAEWEYAARAGTTTRFFWGNKIECSRLSYYSEECKSDEEITRAVMSYSANDWGLYDMHGNVFEWCQDYYAKYSGKAEIDPNGPESGEKWVIRGGSFNSDINELRSANRNWCMPGYRYFFLGARLAAFQVQQIKQSVVSTSTKHRKKEPSKKQISTNKSKEVSVEVTKNKEQSFTNSLGMKFVLIPAGSFMMGSPSSEAEREDDETQHKATLTKAYYLQTTEVTQGQWQAVMGSNPSYFKNCGKNCPVEKVSWDDVQKFIKKLNKRDNSRRYRLPTEAEWEYAARAGTKTPFAFGNCLSTKDGNYDGNYPYENCSKGKFRRKTISVGTLKANSWGLFDMHGNVYEWCQDRYGKYPKHAVIDPIGPSSGGLRVLRGGSWYYSARRCRSAYRYGYGPGDRFRYLGARLAAFPVQQGDIH